MLPSHSTHALQPLNVVVFNSVKNDWSKIVKNHLRDSHKSIKNNDFPRLIKKLFIDKAALSTARIVSALARAGKQILLYFLHLKYFDIQWLPKLFGHLCSRFFSIYIS